MITQRWAPLAAGAPAAGAAAALVTAVRVELVSPTFSLWSFLVVMGILGSTSEVLGVLVALRRPGNAVGPLLATVGLVPCLLALNDPYVDIVTRLPGRLPVSAWLLAFTTGAWMVIFLPAAALMMVFPTGHLLSPRWRWAAVALVVVPVVYIVVCAVDAGPFPKPYQQVRNPLPAPHGVLRAATDLLQGACLLGLLGLLVAAFAALLIRYRRSGPVERAQLKWLALAACALPGTLLLCWLSFLVLDGPDLVGVGLVVLFLSIPAATAIALLRHDLYDVDRALAATVTYGLITVGLLALFSVASFVAGLLSSHGSAVIAAAATAACAGALAPLRSRVQARVQRRLYPVRQTVLAAIEDLRQATHAGTARPEQLATTLAQALDDPLLRVTYRLAGTEVEVDADGVVLPAGAGPALRTPILLGKERVGTLLTDAALSKNLLREVAAACALLVEVVRLRSGLSTALREVSSSRTRLLEAGYAERRRLERDLHDGAQQRLVSLGLNLRVAQRQLAHYDVHVNVDTVLAEAVDQLGWAVAELRQIAHGLRPSSLDDGLGPALTTLAGRLPVPVALDVDTGAVPEHVATTVYYVATEAVTNVVKHATAAQIGLSVIHAGGVIRVRISDDGAGGAQLRPGTGLSGLTDRVAAAGGELTVDSPPGCGTVIEAVLPCAS